jgi:hypothetical protein
MEFGALISLMGIETLRETEGSQSSLYRFGGTHYNAIDQLLAPLRILPDQVRIPGNLSILATMNTSDTSIYYMDSAFKRRWDWEFVNIDSTRNVSDAVAFETRRDWERFVDRLNLFIRQHGSSIRNLEDKQIGYWFIKDEVIRKSEIQNKLMFFLWDSVFPRDKRPLAELAQTSPDALATFGDFTARVDQFVAYINTRLQA